MIPWAWQTRRILRPWWLDRIILSISLLPQQLFWHVKSSPKAPSPLRHCPHDASRCPHDVMCGNLDFSNLDPSTIPILHMASSNTTTCPHAQPPWYQHKGLPPCSSNLIALHSSHSDRDTSTAKTVGGYQFTTFDFSPISSFVLLSLCLRRDVRVLHIYNCFGRI
jgi:hypothetical protein